MYGPERIVIELARHSQQFGYRCLVGSIVKQGHPEPEFITAARNYGIPTVVFPCMAQVDFRVGVALRKFVRINNVDILHTHGYKDDFYALFAGRVKKIATNHLWKRVTRASQWYARFDALFLRFFDHIIGVSDSVLDDMRRCGLNRSHKIMNGVDDTTYRPGPRQHQWLQHFGIPPTSVVLGMISSLTPEKRHEIVIEATVHICQQHPECRLLIIGEGPREQCLRQLIDARGLGAKVVLGGRQSDIVGILSIIDLFLLSSSVEGLPMAVLEAMACGKVVVTTPVGELPRVINHGVNGLLVPGGEPELFAHECNEVLNNPQKSSALGLAARETIERRFNAGAMTGQYCSAYDALLAGSSKRVGPITQNATLGNAL